MKNMSRSIALVSLLAGGIVHPLLLLEANAIVQQNQLAKSKNQRDSIERLWKFSIDCAVAAPDTGKMDNASERRKSLIEFDEASPQQTAAADSVKRNRQADAAESEKEVAAKMVSKATELALQGKWAEA